MKFIVFPLRKKKLIGGVLRSTGSRILYIIKPDLRKYKYIDGSGTLGGCGSLLTQAKTNYFNRSIYAFQTGEKKKRKKLN